MTTKLLRPSLLLFVTLAASGPAAAAPVPHPLSLHTGVEDAALWPDFDSGSRRNFAVVLSPDRVTPALSADVEAVGGEVLAYLPDDALLVRIDGVGAIDLRTSPRVESVKALPTRLKMSKSLSALAGSGSENVRLLVRLTDRADSRAALPRLAPAGDDPRRPRFRFLSDSGHGGRFAEALPRKGVLARAAALAADPDVLWIEPAPEFLLSNDAARWVGQNFDSNGAGAEAVVAPVHAHGIRGEGQVVGIIDDGLDPDHKCFWDPAQGLISSSGVPNYNQRKVIFYHTWDTTLPWNNCGGEGHGGHTAGTVACDFNSNKTWDLNTAFLDPPDGMAPAAKLSISDGGTTDPPGIPADLQPVFLESYNVGARVHSNSWGSCDGTNCYVYASDSHDVDQFMWEHPDFLILFAAGNSGPTASTVSPPGNAKNCITIGATERGTNAVNLAGFSSIGPAEDGRTKPTLTAPGRDTNSVFSQNHGPCSTTVPGGTGHSGAIQMNGTSMATPAASGYAALARQYFVDGWYPTGAKVAANGFNPSAAILKAVLMNGARKLTSETLPSNAQGYGRISLRESLSFADLALPRKLFVDDHLRGFVAGDGEITYTFNVTSNATPFKVSLAWTDPPPALLSGAKLVDNLDLTVVSPGGSSTYLGNVFNTATGFSVTGGAADSLNVEEEVWVQTPTVGTWTVKVKPTNVPIGPQPYGLAVTGAFSAPAAGTPAVDVVLVSDPTGNRDGTADPGETVSLGTTLAEIAGAPLSSITGTLSQPGAATPGFSIVDGGPRSFSNLTAFGSSTATPFSVSLTGAVPCGSLIPLRLTVTSGASNWLLDFGLRVGAPGKLPVVTVADNFDSTAVGSAPSALLWNSTGSTAVDDTIVTTSSADTGTRAVHFLRSSGIGAAMQTQTLNLSTAKGLRLSFAYWANNIPAASAGPYFRVEGCVGSVATTCLGSSASWSLLYGNPNHYGGSWSLPFNSNTLTPKAWSPISLDLSATSLVGSSQANIRFRYSYTGSGTEASTAVYVDSVNLMAWSWDCTSGSSRPDLRVNKVSGKARLTWTGGTSSYSVYALRDGANVPGPAVTLTQSRDEDVLTDGHEYWFWVE